MKPRHAPVSLLYAAPLALGFSLVATVSAADTAVDPDAAGIVKAMATYLGGLQAFSVSTDIGTDYVLKTGEKHKMTSSGKIELRRPGEIHVTRKGELVNTDVFFDGKTFTILGHNVNAYFQAESPGTVDQLIDTLRSDHGVEAPGADLIYSNPYDGLMEGAWTANYYGTSWINGTECHHIGVRADKVDWQLWVQVGDQPLPCQYVITSKWMTGAPEYSIRFYDWNTNPNFAAGAFAFAPPDGVKKVEEVPSDELDKLAEGK